MRGLPTVETAPTTRIRRWDAVILGSAIPGLVAAVRLGMTGARVLIIEEEATESSFPGLREPFWLSGADKDSILAKCLRDMHVPLIDQRSFETNSMAFQIVLPDMRLDVGVPHLTVDEWVAWGLAKPDAARALARVLLDAGTAERNAMLAAPLARSSRRRAATARRAQGPSDPGRAGSRGLPPELETAPAPLAALLNAQERALSNLGATRPTDAARARLLGGPFEGGAWSRSSKTWLRDILRRRIESLYGEFRCVSGAFRLVSAGDQPGLAPDAAGESGEVWVGRAFVLNAPARALAAALHHQPTPEILNAPPITHRRIQVHLRADPAVVPDAMAPRLIAVNAAGTEVSCIQRYPTPGRDAVDLVASTVAAHSRAAEVEERLVATVADLMPFSSGRLLRVPIVTGCWDDVGWLADPPDGGGWPDVCEIRLGTKQEIYQLDRAAVAGLGFEGDLLLGWRGGDAIAADLS
ncbi:MAG: hypothetical protein E2O66_06020 [Deltaproteobacteria bacterium]|nr:hypothetical protein [Myxococcales bacterium]TDJ13061.1 MAG: hypothetical protein E2O66_06020 [Deltaproteobacteria bacterium]TDJ21451.1 MAG: hypothetical protein E2O69_01745 [Deltaproteobacteria bacterium]